MDLFNPVPEEAAPREDIRITVISSVALWASAVLGAAMTGLFAKLSVEETVTLIAFATAFALAAYRFDSGVRAFATRHPSTLAAALGLDAVAAIEIAFVLHAGNAGEALATLPHAAVLAFLLPLAAVASVAALARAGAARKVSSAREKSPGASPAAT